MQIFPSPRVVARQIVAWPSCPWHFAVKTAENSEKQRTFSLLFRRSNWQKPRISAASEMSIAVNFWPKQRKTAMGLVRHSRNIVYQAILPTVMGDGEGRVNACRFPAKAGGQWREER